MAVKFRSLSKTAGFTGTRTGYAIVTKSVKVYDDAGNAHSLNQLWDRRQAAKFNGAAYFIRKGAERVLAEEAGKDILKVIDFYLENAKIIKDGLDSMKIKFSGGINAPYIWLKTPEGYSSWEFFDKLLTR